MFIVSTIFSMHRESYRKKALMYSHLCSYCELNSLQSFLHLTCGHSIHHFCLSIQRKKNICPICNQEIKIEVRKNFFPHYEKSLYPPEEITFNQIDNINNDSDYIRLPNEDDKPVVAIRVKFAAKRR